MAVDAKEFKLSVNLFELSIDLLITYLSKSFLILDKISDTKYNF